MKKFLLLILTLLFSAVMTVSLIACSNQLHTGTVRIVINSEPVKEIVYNLKDMDKETFTAFDILLDLKNDKIIDLDYTASAYGNYLTKVGDISEGDGYYIIIYTNEQKDKDVSAYAKTITYDGVEVTTSGVGIDMLTINDGTVLYFNLEKFE